MKNFLKSIFIDPFIDSGLDEKIVGTIAWLIFIILFGLSTFLFGYIIDSSFLDTKKDNGTVIHKYYTPPHTTTTYMLVGKVLIPQTNYRGSSYTLKVKIGNKIDHIHIQKSSWLSIKIGDEYCFNYVEYRFSNRLDIKSFCR